MMKYIFGIDPGLATTGWALLSVNGNTRKLETCGSILTDKGLTLSARCHEIYQDVQSLLQQHQPHVVIVEELFFSRNVKTAIAVSHARGVIMAACATIPTKIVEMNPRVMKKHITGYGQANKKQVLYMVKRILQLDKMPKLDDTVDAIALAYTGSFTEL